MPTDPENYEPSEEDDQLALLALEHGVDPTPELLGRARQMFEILADPVESPKLRAGLADLKKADQLAWQAARQPSGWSTSGHPLAVDPEATSSTDQPGFLTPPPSAPPFHGFVLLPGVERDGFRLGMITDFIVEPEAQEGDLFLQAPDGSRAFITWRRTESPGFQPLRAADDRTWGSWEFGFAEPLRDLSDAQWHLDRIVPALRPEWERWVDGLRSG